MKDDLWAIMYTVLAIAFAAIIFTSLRACSRDGDVVRCISGCVDRNAECVRACGDAFRTEYPW